MNQNSVFKNITYYTLKLDKHELFMNCHQQNKWIFHTKKTKTKTLQKEKKETKLILWAIPVTN